MDIATYAAVNGLTIEEAQAILQEMGSTSTPEAQERKPEVFKFRPGLYYGPKDKARHYAGRGAARSWRRLPHLR